MLNIAAVFLFYGLRLRKWGRRRVKEKNKVVATKDVVSPSEISEPVGSTLAGITPGMSSYVSVTAEPSRKALNFRTLFAPGGKRSSYDRVMIKLQADVELKYTIVLAMPKLTREGFYTCIVRVEYEWKPPRCACCKVFSRIQEECPKNPSLGVAKNLKSIARLREVFCNKKKGVEPTNEVSNSNPFDMLNPVKNYKELRTNGGTSNMASNGANSSGSTFWNVETSSTSTTPIVDKIRKLKKLIIDRKVTLMDDDSKPLKKVDYLGDHDSEDEVEQLIMIWLILWLQKDPYDDDMYEGHDIPDKIQDIFDNLDIRDQAWMDSSSSSDQELSTNMVSMDKMEKILSDSKEISSSAEETIDEIVQICFWILDLGFSKHMTGNHALLTNLMETFLGMVRFGNDDFTVIAGYADVVIGHMTINKVYYSTCFVRIKDGFDFLTGDRSSNFYTIALNDIASYSSIYLLAKASSSISWLWHQILSHMNLATINNLMKNNLVRVLPKMKFEKDHLCSAYEASEVVISFIKKTKVNLQLQVQRVQTNNDTEFKNKTLAKFFNEVGFSQ
uniref:Uncharacterized protein n=1 Tax=Tanacetum cinerariifolium TaxID=118510 RepID=A0A699GX25_TANCI|nr:hypothetical protein [Tanacetum cinerariifolium]